MSVRRCTRYSRRFWKQYKSKLFVIKQNTMPRVKYFVIEMPDATNEFFDRCCHANRQTCRRHFLRALVSVRKLVFLLHGGSLMSFLPDFNRRNFLRLAAAAPLLGQIAAKNAMASAATVFGRDARQNVYSRLGFKTVINCRVTWTYLSGSWEFPEVAAAQQ